MRLHTLRLRAFGPFATEQTVDFDRLAAGGLFLLEGPTGVGKTTILDAITFALYGGLSGDAADNDRLHSDFADPAVEPQVVLELSLRGVRHRITRVPEHQRPKKRGDGFTREPTCVHLERLHDQRWASLSSNKAEVAELVGAAVGLTREQFTQVALLPQGEFARFLRSDDDERRTLLTRLFGTGLYDRITAELDRRRAEATRGREDARARIGTCVSAALEAAGLEGQDRDTALNLTGTEQADRLTELDERLAAETTDAELALQDAIAQTAKARESRDRAREHAGLVTRRAEAERALAEHEATRQDHTDREQRLSDARRAEPVRSVLELLTAAETTTGRSRSTVQNLVEEADDDLLQGRGGPEKAREAATADQQAAALQPLVDDERALPDRRAALAELEKTAATAAARVTALKETAQALPETITGLEQRLATARETAAGLEGARTRAEEVAKQRAAAERLLAARPSLKKKRTQVTAAVGAHQQRVDDHQQLVQARLNGMAAELASQLVDGQPCAVCGATTHSAPAPAAEVTVSAADLEEAGHQRDEARTERERAEEELKTLVREEATDTAIAGGRTAADLTADAETLTDLVHRAQEALTEAERLQAKVSEARTEAERVNAELLAATTQSTTAAEHATAARAGLTDLETALTAAAAGYESVAARQVALHLAAGRGRELAEALDTLAAAISEETKTRRHVSDEVRSGGFTDVDQARSAVLSASDMAALDSQVNERNATVAVLRAAVDADELAGLDPATAPAATQRAAAAADTLAAAEDDEKTARTRSEAATSRATRFTQRLADVHTARIAHDELLAATAPVIRLANLARGMDGHRRVTLTTYVLRHWFDQVVAAANTRLAAMSSGRYELRRIDEGQTKRQRVGLTLSVIDRHTGEERSPKSLSGGETFYTSLSLSLALGLADVVKGEAGGVDLDTLFIDEGFGSLDTETLDQVMAVVDDLRNTGRVVGIVSHVTDLKDRVQERLEVRRTRDGASTITLIA